MTEFTDSQLQTINDSLGYSIQRVSGYAHHDYKQKRDSLAPIEDARDTVRQMIAERKESMHAH